MTPPLHGKNVLITGASRGLGCAIAQAFAEAGARVGVGYHRSRLAASEVCEELRIAGKEALPIQGDISREDSLDAMFQILARELNPLHTLVANAAFGVTRPMLTTTQKHFDKTMHASAWSLLALVQRAVKIMPPGGRILVISSRGAREVLPGYGLMGPAKAALENIAQTLAVELQPLGLSIHGLIPGPVRTKSAEQLLKGQNRWPSQEASNQMLQQTAACAIALASESRDILSGEWVVPGMEPVHFKNTEK